MPSPYSWDHHPGDNHWPATQHVTIPSLSDVTGSDTMRTLSIGPGRSMIYGLIVVWSLGCRGGDPARDTIDVDHSSPESLVESLFAVARAKDAVGLRTLCSSAARGLANGNFCAARNDTEQWTLREIHDRYGSCETEGSVNREGDVAVVSYRCERAADRPQKHAIRVVRVDDGWFLHPEPNL